MLIYTTQENCNSAQNIVKNITKKTNSAENSNLEVLEAIKTFYLCMKYLLNKERKNEDTEAHFMTTIKCLLRRVDPNTLIMCGNASKKHSPLLQILVKYSHHQDVMIKNAARISFLTILQKCHGKVTEYVISITISQQARDIVLRLKQIALDMQDFYEKLNLAAMDKMNYFYQDELEYLEDILILSDDKKEQVTQFLLNEFIVPFIFTAVNTEKQQVENTSPISSKIAFFLLSRLLQIIKNFEMRECIVEFILQNKEIIQQAYKTKKMVNNLQIISILQLNLQKHKIDIEALYILHILYIVQTHILEYSDKLITYFYSKFLHILLKLLIFNYQFNHNHEHLKLKLIVCLCKPLVEKTIKSDRKWLKLKNFFSEAVEIIYYDISLLMQQNVTPTSVMDEEYDKFVNMKSVFRNSFDNVSYLFQNGGQAQHKLKSAQNILLYYFFSIRSLHLALKNEKENILPIIKNKEKIGKTMPIGNSIQCKKLTHNDFFNYNHFLKFTDRQLLILQKDVNKEEGIVIFNAYYKDISWTRKNNVLEISEEFNAAKYSFTNVTKSLSIQLNFPSYDDLNFTSDILWRAKLNQTEVTRKKLKRLFQIYD